MQKVIVRRPSYPLCGGRQPACSTTASSAYGGRHTIRKQQQRGKEQGVKGAEDKRKRNTNRASCKNIRIVCQTEIQAHANKKRLAPQQIYCQRETGKEKKESRESAKYLPVPCHELMKIVNGLPHFDTRFQNDQ
ncbi:MAG: hypothetical protein HXL32_05105 [Prevotellaceae bacterium]|nr:hypothetical protein [Prevotellaceae bacterium]